MPPWYVWIDLHTLLLFRNSQSIELSRHKYQKKMMLKFSGSNKYGISMEDVYYFYVFRCEKTKMASFCF